MRPRAFRGAPQVLCLPLLLLAAGAAILPSPRLPAAEADLILRGGKVVTVDERFSIAEAVAVRDGRVEAVGSDAEVAKLRGPRTEVVELRGRTVLPGLIDSHAHPADACMTEAGHPIPSMERIRDVLDHVESRARVVPEGEWIVLRQVFITRLEEQRYPTRAELDRAAPRHPVMFATGPDSSLSSLALRLSGIDRDFKVSDGGGGFAEKDPATGEPTGILRNGSRYVKIPLAARPPALEVRVQRLRDLFADYNSVGITHVCDRDASPEDVEVYAALRRLGSPTVRVSVSRHVDSAGPLDDVRAAIRKIAEDPLFLEGDDWLRVIGIKTYLDGGMLTGSAYMLRPWGVSEIYAIRDPAYRGVRFIPDDRLSAMVRAAAELGLQFTAHAVGDGAVDALLKAYAEVSCDLPLRATCPSISHSNFMSPESVREAARLGIAIDVQPIWLHLDSHTLLRQFGDERMSAFQPLRSLFDAGVTAGGGSDHMQKIGALRAINSYDPFLGMATAVTRRARKLSSPLHPEESLTRARAIRLYTIGSARVLRSEDRLGSIEPGKLADLVVLDADPLTCPEEKLASIRPVRTYVGGRVVYSREEGKK